MAKFLFGAPASRVLSLTVSLLLSLSALSLPAQAQTATPGAKPATVIESGKFRLHKFEQPIGEETYEISREGDSLLVTSNFKFTDRGSPVPLTATLRTKQNLTPEAFEIKGNTARGSTIDTSIEIKGDAATIREGKETRQATVPARFFTIAGYAPAAMQMMLLRYLSSNNIKGALPTLPGGSVKIEKRGTDQIKLGDKTVELERYSVSGLIWGREALWLDKQQNLVALVCVDAEFDHFEALRDEYESALPVFVGKAADDGMAALAELSNRISPQRKGALVITNANLIDGTGNPPVSDAVIVMENGRITSVGPRANAKIPKGANVFDAQGKYVLPGLWDMHAHFEQVEWGPVYLAAGVTTVRDVGNEFEFMTAVRDAIKTGRGLGPRILLAGIVDGDSTSALGVIRANTPDEARAVVNRYHAAGFQQIKIYSSVKPDIVKEIATEAHRLGMTVTGHVPRGMNAIQAVEAGMDQINHIQYLPAVLIPKDFKPQPGVMPKFDLESPEAKKTFQFFKDHHTVFDPTLVIFEWLTHSSDIPFSTIEPGAAKLPRELDAPINNTGVPPAQAATARATMDLFLNITGALHRAGLTIVAGTDQTVPGHSLRREIELYVQAGFTPMEAIQAATIVPARVMKMDQDAGTVEAGKLADLILVEGNPLDRIANIRNTRFVITNGRLYDCAQLWQSVGFKP
ncbi:MAG TPA: amidohydrolase family protein [Pyrinomonadaceae bacterium]|jgi:imidazolonepropionase-like amidohydrolase|nr:amidohydrolase family protein [Pyrinomonadaceae bacterium]